MPRFVVLTGRVFALVCLLSTAVVATVAPTPATAMTPATVSIVDITVNELNSGHTNAVISFQLDMAPGVGGTSVDFETFETGSATGSATNNGGDFQPRSGTIFYGAGATIQTRAVKVWGDTVPEPGESFEVRLSNPVGLNIGDGTAVVTIPTNDGYVPPAGASISIADAAVTEGDVNSTVTLDLTLDQPAQGDVDVTVSTTAGTASAGTDFLAVGGTLVTIPDGAQAATTVVTIVGDTQFEPTENFVVSLSNPVNAAIADGSATVTITDNDPEPIPDPQVSVADLVVNEGDVNTTENVTVSLDRTSTGPVSVTLSTSDGSAVVGSDYLAVSTTVTIPAGNLSVTEPITIVGDTTSESTEDFNLTLSAPSGADLGDAAGVVTITDNDAPANPYPFVSVSDVSIVEGDAPGSTLNAFVTFSLNFRQSTSTIFKFSTVDTGSATAGDDYIPRVDQTIFMGANVQSVTRGIKIYGDTLAEGNETLEIQLSDPTRVNFGDPVGVITIVDNEVPVGPVASIGDVTVTEGDVDAPATVTVSLDTAATSPVDVTLSTTDGSATDGADYTAISGQTVTISTGQTSVDVPVNIVGDTTFENTENFTIGIDSVTNASIGAGSATVTINDNDPAPPALSIDDVSVTEDDVDTSVNVTVSLDSAAGTDVDVTLTTSDGSATAGSDYTAISGQTVTITAGQTSIDVPVNIVGDTTNEPVETFDITLSAPVGAIIGDGSATVTITDNDPAPPVMPQISVADASVTEGDTNSTVDVTVSLSEPTSLQVEVLLSTAPGSASENTDFLPISNTPVVFSPNTTSMTVPVTIVGDTVNESVETFDVALSSPTNGTIATGPATGTATVTITDNDQPAGPVVSVGDVTVTELNGTPGIARRNAIVPFTLDQTVNQTVRVEFTTVETGSAIAGNGVGSDFQSRTSFVDIPANQLTKTKAVFVWGDTVPEPTETFEVHITSVTNAGIGDGVGVITILDNDGFTGPQVSIADVSVTEGDVDAPVDVTVSLDGPTGADVDVVLNTADGTAVAGDDYTAVSGVTVTIPAGQTSVTQAVNIVGDTAPEPTEAFTISIGSATNASIADGSATVTIDDNDPPLPILSVVDVSTTEGDVNTTVDVVVQLDSAAVTAVTATIETADGSAVAGSDYVALAPVTITVPGGQTSASQTLTIVGDTVFEPTESFLVSVSGVSSNAVLGDGSATVTIDDNDPPVPAISVADLSLSEGDSTINALVSVSIPNASANNVDVLFTTSDGTATAGVDYTAVNEIVTIPAGSTSVTKAIQILGDTDDEPDETIIVTLTNPVNGVVADGTATVTLVNDDGSSPLPTIDVIGAAVTEGNGSQASGAFRNVSVTFRVSAGTQPTSGQVSFDWTTFDTGSATSDVDYRAADTSQFRQIVQVPAVGGAPIDTMRTIRIWGDTEQEGTETFEIRTSNPSANAQLGIDAGTMTIIDNDGPPIPELSVGDVTVDEDAGNAVVDLVLSGTEANDVTVDVQTANGTAVEPGDYTAVNTAGVIIAAGTTSTSVSIPIIDDLDDENDEGFTVNLSNISANAVIVDNQALVTINDNDGLNLPEISISDASVTEGDGSAPADFVTVDLSLSLDEPSATPVSVRLDTADGSATAGADYEAVVNQTVTFAANSTLETFTVKVYGDVDEEPAEDFTVNLSEASGGDIAVPSATVSINDNDNPNLPKLRVHDAYVTEGDAGERNVEVTFSLETKSTNQVRVDMTTAPGTATEGVAIGDGDYQDRTETLIFGPGDQILKRIIKINGDTDFEGNETIRILLSNPVNANIEESEGTLTILDNEFDPNGAGGNAGPNIFVSSAWQLEGGLGGYRTVELSFVLEHPSDERITAKYRTVDGNRNDGTDATLAEADYIDNINYHGSDPTLVFSPGSQILKRQFRIAGDTEVEGEETFRVVLSDVTNAQIGNEGVITILDQQEPPGIPQVFVVDSIDDEAGNNGAINNATVKFYLDRPASTTVKVKFAPIDGTLTLANGDYNLPNPGSDIISFTAGQQVAEKNVFVVGDNTYSGTGTIGVVLSEPDGLTIGGDGTGTLTIYDDEEDTTPPPPEDLPQVYVIGAVNNEINNANIKAYVDRPYTGTIRVDYYTIDGSATAQENDYTPKSGTLVFAEGEQVDEANVAVTPDQFFEGTEVFQMVLTNPQGAAIGGATGDAIIYDNEVFGDTPEPPFEFADLGVSISSNVSSALPGETVTYTVDVTNNGPDTATGSTATVQLGSGMTFTSTSGCNNDPNGQTCALGSLANGASTSFTVNAVVGGFATGVQTTTVTVDNDAIDNVIPNDTASSDVTVPDPFANDVLYVSSTSGGSVGGVAFADEDILAFDRSTELWSLFFDGSDVGITTLDGFTIVDPTPGATVIDMTFVAPRTLPGAGSVDDSDVVRFTGTTGGTTSGTFALMVDASTLGFTTAGEDVDALADVNGDYVFSFLANFNGSGVSGADEDLVRYPVGGSVSLLLDGSANSLTTEDVIGAWIDPASGDYYLSSLSPYSIPGLSGDRDDIFILGSGLNGSTGLYFDGDNHGFGSEIIDGIHISRP